jgi:hypothetical protein
MEIQSDAVTQVHHGVDVRAASGHSFSKSRPGSPMSLDQFVAQGRALSSTTKARRRPTERTRYQQLIARARATAQNRTAARALTKDRHRDRHVASSREISPNDGGAGGGSGLGGARVNLL